MSEDRPPISCYIRTFNEQRNIERCILAAEAVASEVVIVDSGSTDETVEIAKRLGARVFSQAWLGNGHQKRFAEDKCSNDWLLDLDADEVITAALATEIRALVKNTSPPTSIYAPPLVLVSPAGVRFETFAVAWRNKLYDRRVVRAPAHRAWDQFTIPAGVEVRQLTHAIDHYAYRDLAHLLDKQNKVSSARARETALPSLWSIKARIVFCLPLYFLKHYLLRGYFRGGVEGFALAAILSFGRWLRDVKRYERYQATQSASPK
ncbi:MAG: glycosyltransferase family 2 protein [Hyphomicrobium sp.]|jgi:glycosyltransferase involved in cell wall biosynthesis